jgi:hypothetical protein
MSSRTRIGYAASTFAMILAASAGAKTVYVANDGLDGVACGTKAAPCRSITQGIARASTGDTVSVGPGRYGDLDADGNLGEPGEENGSDAVVDVDKVLRVFSSDGADATAITAVGVAGVDAFVRLSAEGSVFGKRNGGFTILGDGAGTGIESVGAATSIVGNVVLATNRGISIGGPESVATDNRASLCGTGMYLSGAGCLASRNALVGNLSEGIHVEGIGCTLDANVLVANTIGLGTDSSDVTIRRTLLAGNLAYGASIVGSGFRVESSTFYGNGDELAMDPNCAIFSESAIDATGNYWGSPLGPGHDPADLVCSDTVTSVPFATKGKTPKLKPTR